MKTIAFLIVLAMLSLLANGQMYQKSFPKNTISLQLMPFQSSQYFDAGLGLRYQRQITNAFGLYASGAYANHRLYGGGNIKAHIRTAMGGTWFTKPAFGERSIFYAYTGIVYSHFGETDMTIPEWKTLFYPLSFEIGVGLRLMDKWMFAKNFNAGFSYDFIKNEACVNFGYSF
jgi:hypothetical protein